MYILWLTQQSLKLLVQFLLAHGLQQIAEVEDATLHHAM
jgi:hypothetical protein